MPITKHPTTEPKDRIVDAIAQIEQGRLVAMLTLVNIEGNAPYPVGSQMLVDGQGSYLGQITGGCAELALAEQAKIAIATGENTVERYGLGSPYFDIKLPCGSGVDVHFDVSTTLDEYREIQTSLELRRAVSQRIKHGKLDLVKTYYPNERLLIVGKGPIVDSLTVLAQDSGFDVVCFADEGPDVIANYCDRYTALVSLFHEHENEIEILAEAIKSRLFYIGALGSRRTHQARLESLKDLKCTKQNLAKIHGPVGSDIGAVTPSQIAISILSEIISVMNRR